MIKLIFTDGACSHNGSWKGGYAFCVTNDKEEVLHTFSKGISEPTTNNRMELEAYISALEYIKARPNEVFSVASDSAYLVNAINNDWCKNWEKNNWENKKGSPIANPDLWKRIIELRKSIKNHSLYKVKGHGSSAGNILADKLATAALKETS